MRIKYIGIMGLALGLCSQNVSAQKSSVETASLSIKGYEKKSERTENRIHFLKEAKTHVDQAFENETTSNDPKMWLMRAKTYLAIYADTLGEDRKPVIEVADPLEVAVTSIINCHKSDSKKRYVENSDTYTMFVKIAVNTRYVADVAFNNKEYDKSLKYYALTRSLIPYDDQDLLKRQNINDDALLFSLATTTKISEKMADAKPLYQELIKRAYNDPWIYIDLYDIYLNTDHDTVKAIETIDKGRMMFSDNMNLKQQQIFIYSVSGRSNELIEILNNSIEDDPYNGTTYYLRGLMYIRMDEKEKAIADFEKAVENNEDLLDAWEELGQLYYEVGADRTEKANALNLNETDKYNKLNEEAKASYMKAIPCFTQIMERSQDGKKQGRAAQFLMQMYLLTGQMDKHKEIKSQFQ